MNRCGIDPAEFARHWLLAAPLDFGILQAFTYLFLCLQGHSAGRQIASIESTASPSFLDAVFRRYRHQQPDKDFIAIGLPFLGFSKDLPLHRLRSESPLSIKFVLPLPLSEESQPDFPHVPFLWFCTTSTVFSSRKAARVFQRTFRS